jgi:glucosamine--fructose-6-phosphate aminotransferase (isomerizing)
LAGILGYTGLAPAAGVILKSLGYMRYAGCDSWGVLTIDESIHLRRALGDFEESKETNTTDDLAGTTGLAHTRWATHGEPDLINAHPILDCMGSIAVVHNGVVDNFVELRDMLSAKGHTFRTQTDTEVIPHLVEELLPEHRSIEIAMQHALKMMQGSFSFALVSTHSRDRIFAARKKHPIYIGRTGTSSIITSEPSCFPGLAYRVAPLARGSMAILDPKGIVVSDIESGEVLKPNWVGVDRRFLAETRKGYRHYLEKEIAYEPEMLQIISLGDLLGIELLASSFDGADRVFLLSDSGSYNTALVASHLLGDIAKRQTRIIPASEFLHVKKRVFEDDLVVGICSGSIEQSLLEALRLSKVMGAQVAATTGNGSKELRPLAQPLISLNREKMKLSRMGTFVGQAGLALMLAHAIRGNIDKGINELTHLGNSIKDSYRSIQRSVHALAPTIYESNSVFFFGRNTLYPIALEAAMDIQRLANISSIGLERANLGRSNYVTINSDTTCIYFVPKGDKSSLSNAEEAISMGGKAVIGICESENDSLDHQIVVPESRHLFPITGILPAQMLAYEISLLQGTNPDSLVYN